MLETEIKKLTAAIEALTEAVKAEPMGEPEPKPKKEKATKPKKEAVEEPSTETEIDLATLKQTVLGLSRRGKKADIRAKMDEFGAAKLTDLSPADLVTFNDWVEAQV